jgi:Protein of unknown function (DUF3500)
MTATDRAPRPHDPIDGVPATQIAEAVRRWLDGLDAEQRRLATFPFATEERFVWDYRPGDRQGFSIAAMSAPQRAAAMATLDVALSARGASEVRAIMALEPVLGELERLAGDPTWTRRDAERYWFAVFGDPDGSEPWAWRFGGHHVEIELTMAGGEVIGAAPSFLGSNPATVPSGPLAGRRALDGEEALARAVLGSLTPAQRAIAVVDPVAPPDILSGNGRRADIRDVPAGLRHDQLETVQCDALDDLIRHYLDRTRADVAQAEWARIVAAGLAPVTFAWAGSEVPGLGHYYAIRGPNFLIEYDNTQNDANHIHAVWRDLVNDWGEDRLAAHYRDRHTGG